MNPEDKPDFLDYTPTPLAFGTSGLRGLVTDITDLEASINTRGFLNFALRSGDVKPGESVAVAGDLRPSTDRILCAVSKAIQDAGLKVEYAGKVPTPALTYYAMQRGRPSVMVTGSHIPFDRNGIKFNKSRGEVLKSDEPGILAEVAQVRRAEYGKGREETVFGPDGMFRPGLRPALPPADGEARRFYLRRYLDVFPVNGLKGRRLVLYQHSAVGRDLLLDLLESLGAEVLPMGRSEEFIPIDTENVTEDQLARLSAMAESAFAAAPRLDALVSMDGDSDRPLVVGVAPPSEADEKGWRIRFYGGDLLGALVAEYLRADAAAVPVSANDAVDQHLASFGAKLVKTRIGSPYVIAAMQKLRAEGFGRVVSWEANGGFLTGTDVELGRGVLKALPTRDAVLPILCALFSAFDRGLTVVQNFARLPKRFSRAGLLDDFPPEASRAILARFSPSDPEAVEAFFGEGSIAVLDRSGKAVRLAPDHPLAAELDAKRRAVADFFTEEEGFGPVERINVLDGVRVFFRGGDVAHVRPSGNAPQLRVYACADSQARADAIAGACLREPGGILRRIEKALT
jgi:phosphomannomutase